MPRAHAAVAFAAAVTLLAAAGAPARRTDPRGRRTFTLGRSVHGHKITAMETGDFDASRRILVVGFAIWFHQHLRAVDSSEGNLALERRFAKMVGLPLASLTREPGSAVGWENHEHPSGTAFVVELPAGKLSTAAVRRYSRAVASLLPGS